MLHIWPTLPIKIRVPDATKKRGLADNIIDALELNDRVDEISLENVPTAAVTQGPFPELTDIRLYAKEKTVPVFPEAFLVGSAPRLRSCLFWGVGFPGIWKLLLSASHLVDLRLFAIPHSGYVSPEAMVTALSTISNLKLRLIEFRSPLSRPDRANRRPSPLTRSVLPALTSVSFKGASEYIEDLVSLINVPLLHTFKMTLFNQLIFDNPLLHDFFARTECSGCSNKESWYFLEELSNSNSNPDCRYESLALNLIANCRRWLRLGGSSLLPFSTLKRLGIKENRFSPPHWQGDVENTQWLELLRSFTALKELYLDERFTPLVAPALQELTRERVTEVLPELQNLFILRSWSGPSGPI